MRIDKDNENDFECLSQALKSQERVIEIETNVRILWG